MGFEDHKKCHFSKPLTNKGLYYKKKGRCLFMIQHLPTFDQAPLRVTYLKGCKHKAVNDHLDIQTI